MRAWWSQGRFDCDLLHCLEQLDCGCSGARRICRIGGAERGWNALERWLAYHRARARIAWGYACKHGGASMLTPFKRENENPYISIMINTFSELNNLETYEQRLLYLKNLYLS